MTSLIAPWSDVTLERPKKSAGVSAAGERASPKFERDRNRVDIDPGPEPPQAWNAGIVSADPLQANGDRHTQVHR